MALELVPGLLTKDVVDADADGGRPMDRSPGLEIPVAIVGVTVGTLSWTSAA
jgi:hypothetical protein